MEFSLSEPKHVSDSLDQITLKVLDVKKLINELKLNFVMFCLAVYIFLLFIIIEI
jgi:hypothetical protein